MSADTYNIRIAGLVEESMVDGEGVRFTIFTQGCARNCKGCHNPTTHDIDKGKLISVDSLCKKMISSPLINGLTLSGGEPFIQPKQCRALAEFAHKHDLTVWVYTGYTFEELIGFNHYHDLALLKNIDVLVDGPYIESLRDLTLRFRGSSNQRILDVKKSLEKMEPVIYIE